MARFKQTALIAMCVGGAYVLGQSVASNSVGAAIAAQPEADGAGTATDMMMGGPTEHHKLMESMLGEWDAVARFKMDPTEDEWTESEGIVKREMILDGMFIKESIDSSMGPEMPRFKGLGIMGYNTFTNEYESIWMENTSSPISMATGSYDEATKTWTFEGDSFHPMTGAKMKMKTVYIESDPNRHVLESYILADNGKYWKCMTGVTERKHAAGTR